VFSFTILRIDAQLLSYPDWLPPVNHNPATIELFSSSSSSSYFPESQATEHHSDDLTKLLQDILQVFSEIGSWKDVPGAKLICGGVYHFNQALPQYQGQIPLLDPLLLHWISKGESIGDGHFWCVLSALLQYSY
jgi:hypothetical protein